MSAALLVVGAALSAWGVRAATGGDRPLDLVGALAASLGVVLAGSALGLGCFGGGL